MAVIPFHTVDKIMNRKVNLWFADIAMLWEYATGICEYELKNIYAIKRSREDALLLKLNSWNFELSLLCYRIVIRLIFELWNAFLLKKKERKKTVKYSQLYFQGTSFYRVSAGLSEMEMFSISICFLKVYSHNEM
jgi:hypothetical protein